MLAFCSTKKPQKPFKCKSKVWFTFMLMKVFWGRGWANPKCIHTSIYPDKYDAYDHWYWVRYYCFWPRYLSIGVGTLDVEVPVEVRVSFLVTLGAGGILCGVAGIHFGHSELVRKDVQYHLVMVGHHVSTHTTRKIYQNISIHSKISPFSFIKDILL